MDTKMKCPKCGGADLRLVGTDLYTRTDVEEVQIPKYTASDMGGTNCVLYDEAESMASANGFDFGEVAGALVLFLCQSKTCIGEGKEGDYMVYSVHNYENGCSAGWRDF